MTGYVGIGVHPTIPWLQLGKCYKNIFLPLLLDCLDMLGFETRDFQMAQLFRTFSVDGIVGSGSRKNHGRLSRKIVEIWKKDSRRKGVDMGWEYYAILPILDLHVFLIDVCWLYIDIDIYRLDYSKKVDWIFRRNVSTRNRKTSLFPWQRRWLTGRDEVGNWWEKGFPCWHVWSNDLRLNFI